LVECACELLQAIGYTLDTTAAGKTLLAHLSVHLLDLSSSLSKRLQYKIQGLLELQQRGWQEKVLRMQAKTIEEVRRDAEEEAKCVGQGTSCVPFTTRTTGVKPAYITGPRESQSEHNAQVVDTQMQTVTSEAQAPVHEDQMPPVPDVAPDAIGNGMTRSTLYQVDMRRLFAYFLEDRDSESFTRDWHHAQLMLSDMEVECALRCLLEIGIGSDTEEKQGACAEAVAELVAKGALNVSLLRNVIVPLVGRLEDLRLDEPHAARFFEQLLARLLISDEGRGPSAAILEPLPYSEAWTLLLAALKWAKLWGGLELSQRLIGRRELSAALRRTGQCTRRELARILKSEGISRDDMS